MPKENLDYDKVKYGAILLDKSGTENTEYKFWFDTYDEAIDFARITLKNGYNVKLLRFPSTNEMINRVVIR